MKSLRTLFWPSVLAIGFLLFLGSVGNPVSQVAAASGDNKLCRIEGPREVLLGERSLYAFRIQDNAEDVFDLVGIQDTYGAEINGGDGLGYISRVTGEQQYLEAIGGPDFHPTWSLQVQSIDVENPNNYVPTSWSQAQAINPLYLNLLELLDLNYGYTLEGNPCGTSIIEVSEACIDQGFCDVWDNSTTEQQEAWAEAIESATANGVVSCEDLMDIGADAFLDAGGEEEELNGLPIPGPDLTGGINGYWLAVCAFTTPDIVGPILDDVGFIEITCTRVGTYTLSIFDQGVPNLPPFEGLKTDQASIEITCRGPVENASMKALPSPIEIVPAAASVSHSLVYVEVKDYEGQDVTGADVVFTTDRCAIESSAVNTTNEFEAAKALFESYNRLQPSIALEIEDSIFATTAPDSDRQQETVRSFDGIAAVILHCDPIHAPGVTPGAANVRAIVERPAEDFILGLTVTVVGPPAPGGVTAIGAPATVACGEKTQVEVTVLDAIGQPVSDHTLVEVVTNYGGVLAGTGAVAGQAGPVVPVSSTIAETFGGKATFYLLTSSQHVGPYEVVITTGGGAGVTGSNATGSGGLLGGLWTTPPITIQLTFQCFEASAAPAPTTTNPATGNAIKPPSTGDAGLNRFHDSALPWVVGGIMALIATAYLSAKFARD